MTTHTPGTEHVEFDAMCEQLGDYETLPSVKSASPELVQEVDVDVANHATPLNEQILAGLVSP